MYFHRSSLSEHSIQSVQRLHRSSQNAALLQYRLPPKGNFIAQIRFRKIQQRKKYIFYLLIL